MSNLFERTKDWYTTSRYAVPSGNTMCPSFYEQLAIAYRKADLSNRRKLDKAFPELKKEYEMYMSSCVA